MSHLDEWAHLIAKQLKSEAELVGVQSKSDLYEDAARETFIRVVLDPFLPASYAIGSGRVIDASGNISSPQDIVIFRKDYPQFNMPGSHHVFIYESVLATVQVSSKLIRKTFFNALDQCASMGTLNPVIDPATMRGMASKMKMQLNSQQKYIHTDPLNTNRFDLVARPQCFVYAFAGYQTSDRQLAENLAKWVELYHDDHDVLQMKSLPSVIATQGCFGWRNTAPFPIKSRALMGVGIDHAPLRLILLQLMHALNRRLQNTSDGYGIKSTIAPYLARFEPPAISEMIGTALNPGDHKPRAARPPEHDRVAADNQSPVAAIEQSSAAENLANKNTARMVKLVPSPRRAVETEPDESRRAAATSLSGSASLTGKPDKSPEIASASATMEADGQGPVIKNLSLPRRSSTTGGTGAPPADLGIGAKPSSPLSSFSDGTEGDVEEYQFNPIEMTRPQSGEESPGIASDSGDEDFLSTQEINMAASGSDTRGSHESAASKPRSGATERQEDGEDGEFLDTLVETAESLSQDESEPSVRKPKYVTESLI